MRGLPKEMRARRSPSLCFIEMLAKPKTPLMFKSAKTHQRATTIPDQARPGAHASKALSHRAQPKADAQVQNAVHQLETFLRGEIENNEKRRINEKENRVIARLLSSSDSMSGVYRELVKKCADAEWRHIMAQVITVAAWWTPEHAKSVRRSKKRVQDLNKQIGGLASKLADLIEEREEQCTASSLDGHDDTDVVDWIIKVADAGDGRIRAMFNNYVKESLELLRNRFDDKYWPDQAAVLRAIAAFAVQHRVGASNPLTAAAVSSRQSSMRDFWRALSRAIDLLKHSKIIPGEFRFSDKSLAEIANCGLGLSIDHLTYARDVKAWRYPSEG